MKKTITVLGLSIGVLLLNACGHLVSPSVGQSPASIAQQPHKTAVTTANPYASAAAIRILQLGGNATDAAIAAQLVLGLVEPQSSGIGGGALAMVWDAHQGKLSSYDGLASAPSKVTAALNQDVDGKILPFDSVARGGRSVGVPGTLSVLKMLHERHGKLAWNALFPPAIELASEGFALPAYMHALLSAPTAARDHPDLLALYFDANRKILPLGSKIRNLPYATTLAQIAQLEPLGFLREGGAARLVAAAQRGAYPSLISEADVLNYRAVPREPLCTLFLAYKVCAMGPTSFGGVMVLQMLQMLEIRLASSDPRAAFNFGSSEFVHLYAEAGRLAQADRLHYVGDPNFVSVPTQALLAAAYLQQRAGLIDSQKKSPTVTPGVLSTTTAKLTSEPLVEPADATSQLAIVDALGNAISLTTTNNLNFGSRLMVDGYVLNNAMTNFSGQPRSGQEAPNRMQAGKRPVTSMAPLIVFDAAGKPFVVGGSAGGGQIVDYIARSLIEMLAGQRTPAQALARGNISTASAEKIQLEKGTAASDLAAALSLKGHTVEVVPMVSGQGFLMRQADGWIGAADPRRDGVALGF